MAETESGMERRVGTAAQALVVALAFCGMAHADSWIEKDHITTWRFVNGSFRVDVVNDAKNKYQARRFVRIMRGTELVKIIDETGLGTLAASPDERIFVGISNSGLDRVAALIFDRKGNVLLRVSHGTAGLDYCDESVFLIRHWHDSEAADIHFEGGDALDAITVRDCRGNRVNLLQAVGETKEKPAE